MRAYAGEWSERERWVAIFVHRGWLASSLVDGRQRSRAGRRARQWPDPTAQRLTPAGTSPGRARITAGQAAVSEEAVVQWVHVAAVCPAQWRPVGHHLALQSAMTDSTRQFNNDMYLIVSSLTFAHSLLKTRLTVAPLNWLTFLTFECNFASLHTTIFCHFCLAIIHTKMSYRNVRQNESCKYI